MRLRPSLQAGEQVQGTSGDFHSLIPSMLTSNPSLHDDLLLSCIARVSRLYYPTLSLVSKSFRSLLASPELSKARSLLGHTESCLYVCMHSCSDQKPRWFTLCRKTDKDLTNDTSTKKKSSGYVLALIPDSPVNVSGRGLVAFGSSIAKEGRWDYVGQNIFRNMSPDSSCEIENVLYSAASNGAFIWYETEAKKWIKLKGLAGLPKFPRNAPVRLTNYGGKMVVLWEEDLHYYGKFQEKVFWCAEIALERRKSCEIWGEVAWFDHVLTVPEICDVKVLCVTV